ncbi:uncharacterized protein RCC_09798 [Ramularia collo-cygni]|uniref:Uncharacterized protein n=1 Tax=Ramularia collo-cygni TaxID=112498 RepID=A0A2D3VIF7_9PEZI|nr:uncharacterized protein RCC_09798 [Ramularia collo-cygni]CZT24081.1 uncharacterized protein RCC_09798 [Ramularia collo-cygni]
MLETCRAGANRTTFISQQSEDHHGVRRVLVTYVCPHLSSRDVLEYPTFLNLVKHHNGRELTNRLRGTHQGGEDSSRHRESHRHHRVAGRHPSPPHQRLPDSALQSACL